MGYGFGGGPRNKHGITSAVNLKSGKRAKSIVHGSEVCHLWAHKVQDVARNSAGTVFFKGDAIYSYGEHFMMARHIEGPNGKKGVLLHVSDSTVTTNNHLREVLLAIPRATDNIEVFKVDNPKNSPEDCARGLLNDVKAMLRLHAPTKLKSTRAKKWRMAQAYNERYLKLWEWLELPSAGEWVSPFPEDLSTVTAHHECLEYEAGKEAIAEKGRATRGNRWGSEEEREQYSKRQSELEAERARKLTGAIEKWRNGERVSIDLHSVPCMLRIKGEDVETSKGATVPLDHVRRVLPRVLFMAKRCMEQSTTWKPNSTLRLGHYTLDHIGMDGNIHIGCHRISFDEALGLCNRIVGCFVPLEEPTTAPETAESEA